ncbi:hypothetical protein CPC08DRAFT_769475 [Agrocybe pediades]|nr:hypothetical protein CPC08DRAFT_769475 [Agrocybe pediades]
MTGYPSPEHLAPEDVPPLLDRLLVLLENLSSTSLPTKPLTPGPDASIYRPFMNYVSNVEHVEMTGTRGGALNTYLEHFFGFEARSKGDGILPIKESGPAVCALHSVLRDYHLEAPDDNVVKKWIIDILKASEKVYKDHDVPLPVPAFNAASLPSVARPVSDAQKSSPSLAPSAGLGKRPRSSSTSDKQVKETEDKPGPVKKSKSFTVLPTDINKSTKGRKEDELCKRLVNKVVFDGGRQGYSCIAPKCGHSATGNVAKAQVLGHASKSKHLKAHDERAYNDAVAASVGDSLGARLEAAEGIVASATRQTQAAASASSSNASQSDSLRPVTAQGTLNLAPLQAAGKQAKALERKRFQDSVDHIITRLICVRRLLPNILDSPEWKELLRKLNGVVGLP